jgi:hypothetical protein
LYLFDHGSLFVATQASKRRAHGAQTTAGDATTDAPAKKRRNKQEQVMFLLRSRFCVVAMMCNFV